MHRLNVCSLNIAKFVSLFTVLSAHPIVCQPVTNAAFQQIYQLIFPPKCVHQIISLFICQCISLSLSHSSTHFSVHPLLNYLSRFLPSAPVCPQDHKLAHQCVSLYGLLLIYALLTYTCQSVVRALDNLSICVPLSAQSPT